jgi:membrane-associated phospholipid phosphatase
VLRSRKGLLCLLASVFLINLLETRYGGSLAPSAERQRAITSAVHLLEQGFVFHNHDRTNTLAVYAYSTAYYVVFPAIAIAALAVLSRRSDIAAFRSLVVALSADYFLSLPFYLGFPVPERWSVADSGAVLLSDIVSSRLIELIRPISGLTNCFPSFHVSVSVILMIFAVRFRHPLRSMVVACGAIVVLSTFVLGVHWVADIIAGTAVAVVSVAIAIRVDDVVDHRLHTMEP